MGAEKLKFHIPLLIPLVFVCFPLLLHAEEHDQTDDEMQVLRMFYPDSDLVVTPTRAPKRISRVAENITIITAKDIEEINAHTLADILNIVPGVQVDLRGGPGTQASPAIQGSDFRHALVMVDGVPQNNLASSFPDIAFISVQHIERIEIIKGPASSAWGSALGGIINVITKEPNETKGAGMISASIGERTTGDFRGQASGTVNKFGYYLYAGKLISDGLTPNTDVDKDSFYGKFRFDLNNRGNVALSAGYDNGSRGAGEAPAFGVSFRDKNSYLSSKLAFNYAVTDKIDLDAYVWSTKREVDQIQKSLLLGLEDKNAFDELEYGATTKLVWRLGKHHQILVGSEFERGQLEHNSNDSQNMNKYAVFFNDSILASGFSITPGIRYDYTSTNGDFISPSLGITCVLAENTILRASTARGFSTPTFLATFGNGINSLANLDLKMEKVWSYQAGFESAALKYLWLKAMFFRHEISDVIASKPVIITNTVSGTTVSETKFTLVNQANQRRQGIEAEIKTTPLCDVHFTGGFVFVDAEDRDTGETIAGIPRYTADLGVHYDDGKSFKGVVTGHYIWWNAAPSLEGKYSHFIWDLNLNKKFKLSETVAIETFFTVHNLLNSSQYFSSVFKNPGRWLEGGIRFNF